MPDIAKSHRAVFEAVQSQDFEKLRSLYHPDCIYVTGDGVEQSGADAPVRSAQTFVSAFPDLTIEVQQQYLSGDAVSIIEYTFAGTHSGQLEGIPATGKRMKVVACSIVEMRGAKIYRERDYYDNLALMEQLGVVDTS